MTARSIEPSIRRFGGTNSSRTDDFFTRAMFLLAEGYRFARLIGAHAGRALKTAATGRTLRTRLVARAFGPDHGGETPFTGGRVTLVGAGPGDPEMLTLKALRSLRSADVILFDDLVSDAVLALCRRETTRMPVGKRCGRASCSQDDINALMAGLVGQGKHVVRLKSGDPTIFGRAGEEIAQLRAAGIPVSVVPGITAASAMASALSTSLTHRDHAHSVRFVTGHARNRTLSGDFDWDGMADRETTLVFYMGARTAPMIAERLIEAGLPPATPAVIVSAVTRPEERRWQGELRTLGDGIGEFDMTAPIIIGIGDVFAGDYESTLSLSGVVASHAVKHVR